MKLSDLFHGKQKIRDVPVCVYGPPPWLEDKVTVIMTNKRTGERAVGRIRDKTLTAGREAELVLQGEPTVSREHLLFIREEDRLYVQDQHSKNGTFLNNQRLYGAQMLQQNDIITAGEAVYQVNWQVNE